MLKGGKVLKTGWQEKAETGKAVLYVQLLKNNRKTLFFLDFIVPLWHYPYLWTC